MTHFFRFAAVLAMALAFGGSVSAANSTANWTSADYQRAILLACKDELGYRGDARLQSRRASNGTVLVRMAPYDRIDEGAAAMVNDCADRKRGLIRATNDGYPLYGSARGCPRPGPILYRGNLYCYRGR